MKKTTRFAVKKLGRDKTVERCEMHGIAAKWRKLSKEEHLEALKHKLIEEAHELLEAQSPQEFLEELADVHEVLHVLHERAAVCMQQLADARTQKNSLRGSFESGLYFEYFDVPYDTKWHTKFASEPDRYPVIDHDNESNKE